MSLKVKRWCMHCKAAVASIKRTMLARSYYCCLVCGSATMRIKGGQKHPAPGHHSGAEGEQVMRNKYGNVPTRSRHTGRMFQSKLEASREPALLALQNAGEIRDLGYQTTFPLEVYGTQAVDALLQGIEECDACVAILAADVRLSRQKICSYKADFDYYTNDGAYVVEDTKGYITPEYRIKKRLMIAAHNIEIVEPNVSGIQQRARGCGIRGRGTGSRMKGGR